MSPSRLSPAAFTRRKFLAMLGGASAVLTGAAPVAARRAGAATIAEGAAEVIQQKRDGGACGPCALANSLLNGDTAGRKAFRRLGAGTAEQTDALIRRYGGKPSETYGPTRGRFLNGAGLTCNDMPFLVNDFLADAALPEAQGEWLDRRQNEGQLSHVARLRGMFAGSIARGLQPVVEIRSFAADSSVPATGKQAWVNLYAHWLSLIGVEGAAGTGGFACRFADSFTGKVLTGYAHAEMNRPFMATRGFTLKPKGVQDWQWLTGYPYILVEVPELPLLIQTRPWQSRTLVALTYMVHRTTG